MSIEMVLYLIELTASANIIFDLIAVVSLIATFILFVFMCNSYNEYLNNEQYFGTSHYDERDAARTKRKKEAHEKFVYFLKRSIIFTIVFFVMAIITPNQRTMYLMLASNAAKKSEIPEKVLKAIEMKLDEYIDEVKDKVKK